MSLGNVIRNFKRPALVQVASSKLAKRLEPDTEAPATDWAAQRAESVDEYCESVDAALWAETVDASDRLAKDAQWRLSQFDIKLGGGGAYPLLMFLTRHHRPEVVVETGVAAGWSTRAVLAALEANGRGHLYSSDYPYLSLLGSDPEAYVGCVVPKELHDRWTLDLRGDRRALPGFTRGTERIDLVHYDSDKRFAGRRFAMRTLAPHLSSGAIVVMDDIHRNLFFREWVEGGKMDYHVFEFDGKYVGLVGPGQVRRP